MGEAAIPATPHGRGTGLLEEAPLDPFELIKSAFLGLVEGVTEWLPISSTGHLILVNEFVKLDVTPRFWNMFEVVIQLGAILAVCVLFFHELNPFSPRKGSAGRRRTWVLWGKIVVGCLPAAVIGLAVNDFMEEHLNNSYVVAAALIVYGVAFIIIENGRAARIDQPVRSGAPADRARLRGAHFTSSPGHRQACSTDGASVDYGDIATLEDIPWKTALGIGFFQVLAIVPGTSRSGSTIIGGLLLGCTRSVAARFTFFLAVPVMFGASLLKLVKYFIKGGSFGGSEAAIMAVGCVVAFLVSLGAIRWLMGFVRCHDFKGFGVYRIVLGIIVLAYFLGVRPVLGL